MYLKKIKNKNKIKNLEYFNLTQSECLHLKEAAGFHE